MDLNYLFHRQQVEKARAATSPTDEARQAHGRLARCYETIIDEVTGPNYRFPAETSASCASPQR
jgi:hypothetical protein